MDEALIAAATTAIEGLEPDVAATISAAFDNVMAYAADLEGVLEEAGLELPAAPAAEAA